MESSKPFTQSKTSWGLLIVAVSMLLQYAGINLDQYSGGLLNAENLGVIGLTLAGYGNAVRKSTIKGL